MDATAINERGLVAFTRVRFGLRAPTLSISFFET